MVPNDLTSKLLNLLHINYLELLPKLIIAVAILIVFWILNFLVRWILKHTLKSAKVHDSLARILIDNVLWFGIWILAVVVAAQYLGFDILAALAGIGFLGVALSFAAKDSLGNIIAGMLIFWDKPFEVGQWVEVDSHFGEVRDITVRSTRIRTFDNTYIVIPNQTIINSSLINHSAHGVTRIKIEIAIGYFESIDLARQILLDVAKDIPHVLKDPAPDVIVRELGESGIQMRIRVWLSDMAMEQRVRYKVIEEARKALGDAQIEIPYPHRTVILKK